MSHHAPPIIIIDRKSSNKIGLLEQSPSLIRPLMDKHMGMIIKGGSNESVPAIKMHKIMPKNQSKTAPKSTPRPIFFWLLLCMSINKKSCLTRNALFMGVDPNFVTWEGLKLVINNVTCFRHVRQPCTHLSFFQSRPIRYCTEQLHVEV